MEPVRNFAHTLRTLGKSKGYSLAFIVTLGLGIGANTAVFSVVRGILLKPIPHRGGDRLLQIRQGGVVHAIPDATWSVPEINDYRASSKTFEGFAEFSALTFTMLGHDEPSRVRAGIVSGDYFDVLGLKPVLGRLLSSSDDGKKADPVLVLTHDFWQRRFGGDLSVTEKTVRMNGRTVAIVGVLEPLPRYPERTDVFVNIVTSPHHMSAAMSDDRLAIAAVGVFGVLGFSVSRRTKEFGIRSSLGADAGALQRMVLSEGMRLGAAGLIFGAAFSLLLARFLRGFLFGIEPFDPGTLAVVALVLSAVAATASWLPARRASRVAPLEVLRTE